MPTAARPPQRLSRRLASVRLALVATSVAWIGLRLVAPTTPPPVAVERALGAVDAMPSLDSGRIELLGWPEVAEGLELTDLPEVAAAAARMESRIGQANDALSRLAADVIARIEVLPEGPVGLRLAGLLVPFPSPDGDELAALVENDPDRPWETLRRLARLLETRLEEPPDMTRLEDSVQRRELTRVSREIQDAMREKEAEASGAVEAFRAEALEAVRTGGGPFLRRGRGLTIETVLAALLAALLREALGSRSRLDPGLTAAVAPVLALACVIGLAGTRWLPAHPVLGLTPAFVVVAFVLGWATPGILGALARLGRGESGDIPPPDVAARPPGEDPTASTPPPPGDRLPFLPRRR